MNDGWKRCFVLWGAVTLLLLAGCAPTDPPSAEQLLSALSYAILQPEVTCAELREEFDLSYLPLPNDPTDGGMEFEEHWLPGPKGQTLRAWYMPVADEHGTVILSPGAVGPMTCYLFSAILLTEGGWSVVMYDYQGFGGSTGDPSLQSLCPDLEAVVDWTREYTGCGRVTLMGMSLGAIPSVAVAVTRPDAVNAVVLDSPVALGEEIERFQYLMAGQSQEVISLLDPSLLTENIIAQMMQPLLVFAHEEDFVTPPETVELLYERAGGPKEIVKFTGLEHAHGQFQSTGEYSAELEDFLEAIWQR